VAKFRGAIYPTPEVVDMHLVNFKLVFDYFLKKIVKVNSVLGGVCASKTWSFYSACKNLRLQHLLWAKIWFSEQVSLGGYDSTSKPP